MVDECGEKLPPVPAGGGGGWAFAREPQTGDREPSPPLDVGGHPGGVNPGRAAQGPRPREITCDSQLCGVLADEPPQQLAGNGEPVDQLPRLDAGVRRPSSFGEPKGEVSGPAVGEVS